VLVHGHFGNLAEYDVVGPLLAQHARVVAYDQRGQGWSERGPIGISEFADDLSAVSGALELDRPILFGSSFGALVCLGYAALGGPTRGFINQDGRVSDFPEPTPRDPPTDRKRVVSPDEWEAYVRAFGAAGSVGTATAHRSGVRRPDGHTEIRPTAADVFAKEEAFVRLRVSDAYRSLPGPILVLAAEHGTVDRPQREADLAALQSLVDAEVTWFPTGHWISAADCPGVVASVQRFLTQIDAPPTT
jgi:pimeloyl-ACP methyl ester carboxylesterase